MSTDVLSGLVILFALIVTPGPLLAEYYGPPPFAAGKGRISLFRRHIIRWLCYQPHPSTANVSNEPDGWPKRFIIISFFKERLIFESYKNNDKNKTRWLFPGGWYGLSGKFNVKFVGKP